MNESLEHSLNNLYDFFTFYEDNPIMKVGSKRQMSEDYVEDENDWSEKIESWELFDWLQGLTIEQHEVFSTVISDSLNAKKELL